MSSTFPKDIMDCMKGCILSIFWAKKDIINFFNSNGCTSRELIAKSVYETMTRDSIVDEVFRKLEERTDNGDRKSTRLNSSHTVFN